MTDSAPTPPYPNPPIVEALVEIGVRPAVDADLESLRRLATSWGADYPRIEPTGLNRFRPGPAPEASAEQDGYKLTTDDRRDGVRLRSEDFTFSRLAPYGSWEPLRDDARRRWAGYRDALRPAAVTSAAVRYVNRLDLPGSFDDLPRYLTVLPSWPAGLGGRPGHLFVQFRLPQDDGETILTLTQATTEPPEPGVVSVVLDLDLHRPFPNDGPADEDALWKHFEALRRRKNEVFESCITDRTRKLFR